MLKPLEVLRLYQEHDYTLCSALESRRDAGVRCVGQFIHGAAGREQQHDARAALDGIAAPASIELLYRD